MLKARIFALVLPAASFLTACGSTPPAPTPAYLKVQAEPTVTSVYADDQFIGSARFLFLKPAAMHPGVKYLTFTAPGYFPHDLKLNMPRGTTTIAIKLRPIPP